MSHKADAIRSAEETGLSFNDTKKAGGVAPTGLFEVALQAWSLTRPEPGSCRS